jgi:hypothetical protein
LVKIHHLSNNGQIGANRKNSPYIPIRFGKVRKWLNFASKNANDTVIFASGAPNYDPGIFSQKYTPLKITKKLIINFDESG